MSTQINPENKSTVVTGTAITDTSGKNYDEWFSELQESLNNLIGVINNITEILKKKE